MANNTTATVSLTFRDSIGATHRVPVSKAGDFDENIDIDLEYTGGPGSAAVNLGTIASADTLVIKPTEGNIGVKVNGGLTPTPVNSGGFLALAGSAVTAIQIEYATAAKVKVAAVGA